MAETLLHEDGFIRVGEPSEAAGNPFDCGGAAESPVSFIFGTPVESAQTFGRLVCPMSAPMLLARLD